MHEDSTGVQIFIHIVYLQTKYKIFYTTHKHYTIIKIKSYLVRLLRYHFGGLYCGVRRRFLNLLHYFAHALRVSK